MIHNNFVSLDDGARPAAFQWLCIVALFFVLSACSGIEEALNSVNGGDEDTTSNTTPPVDDSIPPEDEMPTPVDPDPTMDPPAVTDVMLFEQTLHPLLLDPNNVCVACHGVSQIPLFAVEDVTAAYNVLITQQKVNLTNPELSRIYLRPAQDRHICGGAAICDMVAADFLLAIQTWAQLAAPDATAPPPMTLALSASTNFAAAMEGGTARVDANTIAMFTFDEGTGDVAVDSSGVGAPITLQIQGMEWVEGGGLRNVSGKAQASLDDSRKLFDMITPNAAFSVETWVIPNNTAQDGPARIVSYSLDTAARNFTLGQNAIYYQLRNRSLGTGANGTPTLEALDQEVNTVLQHVVATFDEASGRKVYINGQLIIAENTPDTLNWANDHIFVLGNEVTDNRLWQGVIKFVAIHNTALTSGQVRQNFDAGAGTILTLRFDLADVVGTPAYIDMQAAQIDEFGYLFAEPVFVSDTTGIRVKNIRIAVNDVVPVAEQVFRRVDTTVMQSGTQLSPLGALIPVALGSELDLFHLEFEMLANSVGSAETIAPASAPPPVPDVPEPDVGVRTFSQINDTMSSLTGIDASRTAVVDRYSLLRDSLPSTSDVLSFAAAQQIAIQRLATTYCGEIVNNAGRCDGFFGQCQIDANAKDQVATTLYDRLIGVNIANQPDAAGVSAEVVRMIDDLGCVNGCSGTEAQLVLNATCAAVLSSGAVTIN